MEWVVETQNIRKSFGYRRVLRGISFKLRRGEYFTILGRNGCGKTTLLNILATALTPSQGSILIEGLDTGKKSLEARRKIGFVSHATWLYSNLTLTENLRYYGRMYGVPEVEEKVRQVVRQFELEKWQDQRVGELSRGIQQRTAISRALIHDPTVLLIDEPESGLDPAAMNVLEKALAERRQRGATIIATSHNLNFAAASSSRVAILAGGHLAYESGEKKPELSSLQEAFDQYSNKT
jgi:heme exporter protein A